MGTLIIDIETSAPDWKDLPGITRSALTSWIDRSDLSEDEKNKKRKQVQSKLALSPLTGSIISLAVHDVERNTSAVYFVSDEPDDSFEVDGLVCKQRTEIEILEDFWESAASYDVFVTFNGRVFTVPFLYHRSIVHGVHPTVDIARQRYVTRQTPPYHIDLLDEFSFYGGMTHRPSLQLLCGAYGLSNTSLLAGEEIEAAYKEHRFRTIAEKNAGDVAAITALYEKWKRFLAPRSFLNSMELL